MADVFISYKREERAAVERLATTLRRLGLSVWFDASMSAGEAFSDEIDREAHAAKAILVCWSPTARESQWVKSEALIGFERSKLAACYVAGPDGFYAPTPFNAIHAEDLRAWLAAPSDTHAGWKSILRRIGKLCGRADIETYGALDVQASAADLNAWIDAHAGSPLFVTVEALLRAREVEESERARIEQAARERRAREDAARREREAARVREEMEQARLADERRRREAPMRTPPAPPSWIEQAARREREAARVRAKMEQARLADERRRREAPPPLPQVVTRPGDTAPPSSGARWIAPAVIAAVALIALFVWQPWRSEDAAVEDTTAVSPGAGASAPRPGETFRDCDDCPEMVVIAAGSFMEYSSAIVSIGQFAVGKFEVTFDQWAACVNRGGCARNPGDEGWGRGNRPVINVSWNDAQEYVQWLSRETGRSYRLLTEAEWDYAARAGTATSWPWYDDPNAACQYANLADRTISSGATCSDGVGERTAPVGRYRANAFGLYDMHGNVWEWVQDCFVLGGYESDGSAREEFSCSERTMVGGGWNSDTQDHRSRRASGEPSYRVGNLGFRVARTL